MGCHFGVQFAAALVPRKPQVLLIAVGLNGNSYWGQQRELERCPGHAAAVGNPRACLLGRGNFRKQHTLNPRRGSTRAFGAGWCLSTRDSPFSRIVALRQQSPPGATPKSRPKVRDAAAPVPEVGRLPDAVAIHDGGHQPAQHAAVLEVVPLAGRVARVLIHGDGGADEEPLPVRGRLCPGLSAVRQRGAFRAGRRRGPVRLALRAGLADGDSLHGDLLQSSGRTLRQCRQWVRGKLRG